jgi:hypothetical protein
MAQLLIAIMLLAVMVVGAGIAIGGLLADGMGRRRRVDLQ